MLVRCLLANLLLLAVHSEASELPASDASKSPQPGASTTYEMTAPDHHTSWLRLQDNWQPVDEQDMGYQDEDPHFEDVHGGLVLYSEPESKRKWSSFSGAWGKRAKWNNFAGAWGKRAQWNGIGGSWGKRADWDGMGATWGKRAKWNGMTGAWGKRARWSSFGGAWGKRAKWDNFGSSWGKRKNWDNFNGAWGKRKGWDSFSGGWGKRSLESRTQAAGQELRDAEDMDS